MSEYYSPKRTKNLYEPSQVEPFKLSRSKIDLFIECKRCFFLDRRLGVGRPPGFPFALNSAVDHLLKKEFDSHRALGNPHPLMESYGIKAIPFANENMETWRHNFSGVQALHDPTNFLVFGAVDDIWIDEDGKLIVVDYKSTSKDTEINLDAEWQNGYKRQMEIYQWLLRQNGFEVSDTGYFVYANGQKDREAFDAKLEFNITLIPYTGDDSWVETTLIDAKNLLDTDAIPEASVNCDYCAYRESAGKTLKDFIHSYRK
jgi:CRISPR/Cas system-associated exonuclease Cas4 (RecB family)